MDSVFSQYTAVEDAFSRFIKTLTNIQDSAQQQWIEFKQQRSVLERNMAKHMQATSGCKKISLDVGGTTFNTTEETLLKHEESFFWGMLRSGAWEPDKESGQYFIDRSPHMFGVILDYLRDGEVRVDRNNLPAGEKRMLEAELDFYQISLPAARPPTPVLRWKNTNAADVALHPDGCVLHVSSPAAVTRLYTMSLRKVRHFTLEMLGANQNALHDPVVYVGAFGVRLQSGKTTNDGGKTTTATLPSLANAPGTCREYKFRLGRAGSQWEWEVTWPTGDKKVFTLNQRPEECMLGVTPGTCAVFSLKP